MNGNDLREVNEIVSRKISEALREVWKRISHLDKTIFIDVDIDNYNYQLKSWIDELNDNYKELSAKIEALQSVDERNKSLVNENSSLKEKLDNSISEYSRIKKELQDENSQLKEKNKELEEKNKELEDDFSTKKKELRKTIDELEKENESLKSDKYKLEIQINNLNDDKTNLQSTIAVLTEDKKKADNQINNLEEDNRNLQNKYNDLNGIKDRLKEENRDLNIQINGLDIEVKNLKGEIDSLNMEKEIMTSKINSLNSDNAELNCNINQLNNEKNELESQIDTLTENRNDLEEQVEMLETEKECLEKQAGELTSILEKNTSEWNGVIVQYQKLMRLMYKCESLSALVQGFGLDTSKNAEDYKSVISFVGMLGNELTFATYLYNFWDGMKSQEVNRKPLDSNDYAFIDALNQYYEDLYGLEYEVVYYSKENDSKFNKEIMKDIESSSRIYQGYSDVYVPAVMRDASHVEKMMKVKGE